MSADLLPVWNEIEKYIDQGISVIPVRDKDDSFGVAKSPYGKSWKQYQTEVISRDVLFDMMDKYNTIAVGIVGGKVSRNLEIIDIDVKYKAGIDATLFTDLKTLYPDLLAKLRIHKSPSGGYHILYRCADQVEGNQKLAGRTATPEELVTAPKTKTYNFLETRGEGGYVVAPPALGYKIIKDVPIPILTKAERDSIIGLCRSYNEIIKVDAPYKATNHDNQYYDTNPFEDFNNRCDPGALMQELGWKEFKHNNHFIWFTRPDKNKGVSISFNLQKRFFFCFTASTELEENKGYTPANLLATIQFNGDKKLLYAELVRRGYGRIKAKVEEKLAKQAAINGRGLPANISTDAKSLHVAISESMQEAHPFGVFWIDTKDGVIIDRELLYRVAADLGFKLWNGKTVQSDGNLIEEVEERFFFDSLKNYIQEEDAFLYKDICNAYESFIEKHGRFTISRLPILPNSHILHDTKDTCFKCYSNGVLKIESTSITLLPSVNKLIWKKNIQPRDYNQSEVGKYIDFVNLATGGLTEYLYTCIGYLAHEYKDETAGYIIVLTEQCENPKDGGGAGKNVFCELFKKITTYTSKPGAQIKYDEKFMQSWNGQKIFCLSDVPKSFDYSFLKELSTGSGLQKKLFKDEAEIASELMPKFLIQTNFSVDAKDGGVRRRIRVIEFTDFFTKCGGIDVHFGVHFPNEWSADDWAGYDTLMAKSVQKWLQSNRKIKESNLSESGWHKQFEQTWGQVITTFIKDNFADWLLQSWVSNDLFKQQLEEYYRANSTAITYRPSMIKINNALKDWCGHKGVQYTSDIPKKVNSIVEKYKWFGTADSTPF